MTLTPSEVASLSRELSYWEYGEYICAALVTLGCIGEYIANFTNWLTDGVRKRKESLSAFAEFERDCIRERVRAGMRNARAKGKCIGRPPRTQLSTEDRRAIAETYWGEQTSYRQLAKRFETSVGTVQRCTLTYQEDFAAGIGKR